MNMVGFRPEYRSYKFGLHNTMNGVTESDIISAETQMLIHYSPIFMNKVDVSNNAIVLPNSKVRFVDECFSLCLNPYIRRK